MWGSWSWRLKKKDNHDSFNPYCFGNDATSARRFFHEALASDKKCDVNWYEGATGNLGAGGSRPRFSRDAPALLGFDDTIMDVCKLHSQYTEKGENKTVDDGKGGKKIVTKEPNWNSILAHKCVESNKNILRLISHYHPWNMCQNLQWVLCAVRGKLPGQSAPHLEFAKTPKSLDLRLLNNPALAKHNWWPSPHDTTFAVTDVYYAETCLLAQICTNHWDLFSADVLQTFVCDLDPRRYYEVMETIQTRKPLPPPPPAYTAQCDASKCDDVGKDCCAPLAIGEVAACLDGYVPVRKLGRKNEACANGQWLEGAYECCAPAG